MPTLDGFHMPTVPAPEGHLQRSGEVPQRWRIDFNQDDIDRLVAYLQDLDENGLLSKVGMTSEDVAALERTSLAMGIAPFAFTLFCDDLVDALKVAWVCGYGHQFKPSSWASPIWDMIYCEDWVPHGLPTGRF